MSIRITHDIKFKKDYELMFDKIMSILNLTVDDNKSFIIKSEFDKKEKEIMELNKDVQKIYKRVYCRNIETSDAPHRSITNLILKHMNYKIVPKSYQYKTEDGKYKTSVKYFIKSIE